VIYVGKERHDIGSIISFEGTVRKIENKDSYASIWINGLDIQLRTNKYYTCFEKAPQEGTNIEGEASVQRLGRTPYLRVINGRTVTPFKRLVKRLNDKHGTQL